MSIGEGIFLGFTILGFFVFLAYGIFKESKIQKEYREYRDSVKKSLDGIYKELSFGNYLNFTYCEEDKNEN